MTDLSTAGNEGSTLAEERAARRARQYARALDVGHEAVRLANFHADTAARALSLAARIARLAAVEGVEVAEGGVAEAEPATEPPGAFSAGLATFGAGRMAATWRYSW